jgi:hypothetical protein
VFVSLLSLLLIYIFPLLLLFVFRFLSYYVRFCCVLCCISVCIFLLLAIWLLIHHVNKHELDWITLLLLLLTTINIIKSQFRHSHLLPRSTQLLLLLCTFSSISVVDLRDWLWPRLCGGNRTLLMLSRQRPFLCRLSCGIVAGIWLTDWLKFVPHTCIISSVKLKWTTSPSELPALYAFYIITSVFSSAN